MNKKTVYGIISTVTLGIAILILQMTGGSKSDIEDVGDLE